MALPSSYSNILADLNRDVLRAQPTDALQFCANWFSARLEAERAVARQSTDEVHMHDSTPPLSARSVPGDPREGPPPVPSKNGTPPPAVQGYTFGGLSRPSIAAGMDVEPASSTTSTEYPTTTTALATTEGTSTSSPFSRPSDRAGSAALPSSDSGSTTRAQESGHFSSTRASGSSSRGPPAPLNLAPREDKMVKDNDDDDSSDDDVDDPRDNPNYNPHATSASGGGTGTGIPVGYNLGRRTSVSAESLDPNAPTSHLPKTVIPKTASQRQRIEASIADNLLFRNLDEDQYTDVLNAMKEVSVQKGTEVIIQGAVGDFFYVVEEGTFEVWVRGPPTHTYTGPGTTTTTRGEEKQVATYGPGGSFGELALMYNAPRAATVVSTSRATMWALDRVTFRSILMEHTSRKRKMYEAFLSEVPILASLTTQERAKIADALEEKVYDEGEKVVVEGEVGKSFYIIESGKAEVSRRRRNSGTSFEEEILGTLGKGDYFGELALLNSAPRAATVRAMLGEGRLRVATLGEKAFTRLLGPVIDILQRKAQNSYGPGSTGPSPLVPDSMVVRDRAEYATGRGGPLVAVEGA